MRRCVISRRLYRDRFSDPACGAQAADLGSPSPGTSNGGSARRTPSWTSPVTAGYFIRNCRLARPLGHRRARRPAPIIDPGITFVQGDSLALSAHVPSGHFDVVFISNYLEHLASAGAGRPAAARGGGRAQDRRPADRPAAEHPVRRAGLLGLPGSPRCPDGSKPGRGRAPGPASRSNASCRASCRIRRSHHFPASDARSRLPRIPPGVASARASRRCSWPGVRDDRLGTDRDLVVLATQVDAQTLFVRIAASSGREHGPVAATRSSRSSTARGARASRCHRRSAVRGTSGCRCRLALADAGLRSGSTTSARRPLDRVAAGRMPFMENGADELLPRSLTTGRLELEHRRGDHRARRRA